MEATSKPEIQSQSILQHRQQEQQRQAKFFKWALPIALVIHGIAIGGGAFWVNRAATTPVIDEVEIIADDQPKTLDEKPDVMANQPIDANGQGGDFTGGGGGGGSSKFSLVQTDGGSAEGNNMAALGSPFSIPDATTGATTGAMPIGNSEPAETVPEEAIVPEEKPKPQPKSEPNAAPKPQPLMPKSDVFLKKGELTGQQDGKSEKVDPNGGNLNANAPTGAGRKGGTGTGRGWGRGSGVGNGIGSGTGDGIGNGTQKKGNSGRPGIKPIEKTVAKPVEKPIDKPASVAIVTPPKPVAEKGPKCIENCSLDEYLGAEGSLRISQEIDKNGNVIPKLLQSSGDPELDRKALEAVQKRKYETSDEGYTTNLRVTSQQEGSDFARQQEARRQQERADREAINRDRALQEQERQTREAEKPRSEPIQAPIAEPVAEPVAAPATKPVAAPIAEPVTKPEPEPVVIPVAKPEPEPVAPIVEPIPAFIPAPVVPVIPEPVAPEPVALPPAPSSVPTTQPPAAE